VVAVDLLVAVDMLDAVDMLAEFGVGAEVWSVISYGELHREAVKCDRAARLGGDATKPWVSECLGEEMVTVAVSDNMTAYPKLIDPWVGGEYTVLGADGFGRSDTRENLRRFFEVDKEHIVVATLSALEKAGKVPAGTTPKVLASFGISPEERADIASI